MDTPSVDPVVVGRNVFSLTNDTVSRLVGYIQDVLCAIVDSVLDLTKGTSIVFLSQHNTMSGMLHFYLLPEFLNP